MKSRTPTTTMWTVVLINLRKRKVDPSNKGMACFRTPVGLGRQDRNTDQLTYGEGNPLDTGIYYQGDGETNHRPWSTILSCSTTSVFALYLIGMVVIIFLLSQMSSWMQQMGVSEKYTSTFAQSVYIFCSSLSSVSSSTQDGLCCGV